MLWILYVLFDTDQLRNDFRSDELPLHKTELPEIRLQLEVLLKTYGINVVSNIQYVSIVD